MGNSLDTVQVLREPAFAQKHIIEVLTDIPGMYYVTCCSDNQPAQEAHLDALVARLILPLLRPVTTTILVPRQNVAGASTADGAGNEIPMEKCVGVDYFSSWGHPRDMKHGPKCLGIICPGPYICWRYNWPTVDVTDDSRKRLLECAKKPLGRSEQVTIETPVVIHRRPGESMSDGNLPDSLVYALPGDDKLHALTPKEAWECVRAIITASYSSVPAFVAHCDNGGHSRDLLKDITFELIHGVLTIYPEEVIVPQLFPLFSHSRFIKFVREYAYGRRYVADVLYKMRNMPRFLDFYGDSMLRTMAEKKIVVAIAGDVSGSGINDDSGAHVGTQFASRKVSEVIEVLRRSTKDAHTAGDGVSSIEVSVLGVFVNSVLNYVANNFLQTLASGQDGRIQIVIFLGPIHGCSVTSTATDDLVRTTLFAQLGSAANDGGRRYLAVSRIVRLFVAAINAFLFDHDRTYHTRVQLFFVAYCCRTLSTDPYILECEMGPTNFDSLKTAAQAIACAVETVCDPGQGSFRATHFLMAETEAVVNQARCAIREYLAPLVRITTVAACVGVAVDCIMRNIATFAKESRAPAGPKAVGNALLAASFILWAARRQGPVNSLLQSANMEKRFIQHSYEATEKLLWTKQDALNVVCKRVYCLAQHLVTLLKLLVDHQRAELASVAGKDAVVFDKDAFAAFEKARQHMAYNPDAFEDVRAARSDYDKSLRTITASATERLTAEETLHKLELEKRHEFHQRQAELDAALAVGRSVTNLFGSESRCGEALDAAQMAVNEVLECLQGIVPLAPPMESGPVDQTVSPPEPPAIDHEQLAAATFRIAGGFRASCSAWIELAPRVAKALDDTAAFFSDEVRTVTRGAHVAALGAKVILKELCHTSPFELDEPHNIIDRAVVPAVFFYVAKPSNRLPLEGIAECLRDIRDIHLLGAPNRHDGRLYQNDHYRTSQVGLPIIP